MTIHLSFLDDWAMIDELDVGDQSHTAISEFTSGVEQAAALWSRPKRAYDASIILDTEDAQAKLDAMLWTKRQLNGQSGRLWVPEPEAELIVAERFGTGDGSTKSFLLPAFDTWETGFPKIYNAGVWLDLNGAESKANEVSVELARATDETDWSVTNGNSYGEPNYQWIYTEGCVEIVPSSAAVVTLETIAAERVDPSVAWPTGAVVYATVALRGDITQDLKVGVRQYNSTPAAIDTSYGSATSISEGAWTLVHSGPISIVSGFDTAAIMVESAAALAGGTDNFYVGGVCLNLYAGGEWFDPTTGPHVVQFSTAPAAGNALTFSGRVRRMTRCRLASDNLNHVRNSRGYVEVARLKMLEVVE